jgi:alpha-beta hydrolase superfamily lysophospholipase
MNQTSFSLETFAASDGYRFWSRRYPATGVARANLVCLHGIQSHGGWYEHSCTELARAGFNVYFLDRRGSGLNDANRGDVRHYRRLLDDVVEFVRGPIHAGLPVFLLGISWGGKLAVALERYQPGLVKGLVLVCPGVFPQVRLPFLRRLRIFLARWLNPCKLFPIPLTDPELFTTNPRWLDFLRTDPLALHLATARFLVHSTRLDWYARRAAADVKIPVLLQLAEQDRIIDNGKTRAFVESFATADKEIIEYPGAHHTLEFEPDPEPFITAIRHWLEKRVP